MSSDQEQTTDSAETQAAPTPASVIVPDTGAWIVATELLSKVKRPPSNFVVTIRTMLAEVSKGNTKLSNRVRSDLRRILRANSIKACYYFASQAYKPSLLKQGKKIDFKDFEEAYTPVDHAALLALIILNRAFAKKSKGEEWAYIEGPLYEALDVGALVSRHVKGMSLGITLLVRGMRYLAFAPFLWASETGFKEYRRHLKKADLPFDLEYENKTWGCTNVHIASLLLNMTGFNRDASMGLYSASSNESLGQLDPIFGVQFRAAESILNGLMEASDVPNNLPGEFVLTRDQWDVLASELSELLNNHSRPEWLNKGKSNVTIESTPELFDPPNTSPETEAPN